MDADKVEHRVVHTWVNDDAPIRPVDDVHLTIPGGVLGRARVCQRCLTRDQEAESTLARRKGGDIAAGNLGAGFRLKRKEQKASMSARTLAIWRESVRWGKRVSKLTWTPSAPMTRSPCTVSPFSSVTVAVAGSTSTTRLDVRSSTGTPFPSASVARFFKASCKCTRYTRSHFYKGNEQFINQKLHILNSTRQRRNRNK